MKDIPTGGELKPKKKWTIHWHLTKNGVYKPFFRRNKRKRFYPTNPKV